MGEMADDCYDRALDEMMDPHFEDDYTPPYYSPRPRRRPVADLDDFDTLE